MTYVVRQGTNEYKLYAYTQASEQLYGSILVSNFQIKVVYIVYERDRQLEVMKKM